MAAGIYRLTFSSGKYYIGKSLDLETRWKQHFNKFATGKAARPMQLEYDRCGLPDTEVIFDCHQDHIDILEEWLIDQFKGPDMLNSTYPKVTRTPEIAALIDNNRDLLRLCTWDHLKLIGASEQKVENYKQMANLAKSMVKRLRDTGYILDEDYVEAVNTAQEYRDRYRVYQQELERLSKLSWWDRLFNYKVYV